MNWERTIAATFVGAVGFVFMSLTKDAPDWAVAAVTFIMFNQVMWGDLK